MLDARDVEGMDRQIEAFAEHGSVRVRVAIWLDGGTAGIEIEPTEALEIRVVAEGSVEDLSLRWQPQREPQKMISSAEGTRVVGVPVGRVLLEPGSELQFVLESDVGLAAGRYRLSCRPRAGADGSSRAVSFVQSSPEERVLVVKSVETPQDRRSFLLYESVRARDLRDFRRVIALETERAELQPDDSMPHRFIAGAYRELGDFGSAIFHLERALELARKQEGKQEDAGARRFGAGSVADALAVVYILDGQVDRAEGLVRAWHPGDADAVWARLREHAAQLAPHRR